MKLEIEDQFFTDAWNYFIDPLADHGSTYTQLTPVKLEELDFKFKIGESYDEIQI